jgi:photosystem II stability/assembly factor-like uncharacterized protein
MIRTGILIALTWSLGALSNAQIVSPAIHASATTELNAASVAPAAIPYVWRDTKMIAGGFITGIVFSLKTKGLVYCRTDIGGAYRMDPGSKVWVPLTDWVGQDEANLLGIEAIGLDRSNSNRLYLAAGTYTSPSSPNGFLLRSTDRGRTFDRVAMPFKMGGNESGRFSGDRLVVDPASPNVLLLGSRDDGLWRSRDYGSTWTHVDGLPVASRDHVGVISILLRRRLFAGHPTQDLYAAISQPGGFFRSRDGGLTWIPVPGQPDHLLPTHAALAKDGSVYLTYADVQGPSGMKDGAVWRYRSRGDKWTDITPTSPIPGIAEFGYSIVAPDLAHRKTLIVATMDRYKPHDLIFRSTDRGRHWKEIAGSAPHDSSMSPWLRKPDGTEAGVGHWIGSLAIDPFARGHVLYGTGETMWGTQDADRRNRPPTWTVAAEGIEETAVLHLLSPPVGPALFSALGDISGFRHQDLNATPREGNMRSPLLSNTTAISMAGLKPEVVVRVGQVWSGRYHGGISRDRGATWAVFPTEPPSARGGGSAAISADGSTILWEPAGAEAFRSVDDGATWLAVLGLPGRVDLLADVRQPATFYAFAAEVGTLYRSEDGGVSFTLLTDALPKNRRSHLAQTPQGEFWLTSGTGLSRGTDPAALEPLTNVDQANAIGFGRPVEASQNSTLFLSGKIAGEVGIFRSTDEGRNWLRIDDSMHHYGFVGVISGDPKVFGRVYLGTNGRGIPYGDPAGSP